MKTFFAFVFATLSIFIATSASAQVPFPQYWDPTETGSATAGGAGTYNWDLTDPFWYDGMSDVVWTNSNDAYFEGTAGTVTLTTGITAGDIYFTNVTGNYNITNDGGGETLTISGGNNIIDTGGSEDIIGTPISNSGTLNKNGNGRLHLAAANNLSTVMINRGTVTMDLVNTALGSSATVVNGAALEVNGGTNNVLNGAGGVDNLLTINGTGINNGGAIRNTVGLNTWLEQITLAGNSEIYAATNSAFLYDGSDSALPMTDGGHGYNLSIVGPVGNVQFVNYGLNITGSLLISNGASCYMYVSGSRTMSYSNSVVSPGGLLFAQGDNGLGSIPLTAMATNTILDGGTLSGYGTWTQNALRGVTITTNGATIEDTDTGGTWTMSSIYGANAPLTVVSSGATIALAVANTSTSVLNIGTGTLTLTGGNTKLQSGTADTYSNLVINGSTFTFNYDTSGGAANLGAVPSSYCPSNIWFNGGQFHVGHSTTIAATRGIYVTSAGALIEEVTGGGTATIAATINGPGAVNFDGNNVLLEANNSYGATTVGAGILRVGNGGSTGTLGTGNTSLTGGMYFNRTGSYTYGGAISGTGAITNQGSGTVTLTGPCTYTGVTKVTAGTLLIDNTNASTMTVFSGGTLGGTGVFGGAITVNSGGTLALGTGTLSASNNVTLSGNVTVSVNPSASPSSGEAIVAGTLTGGSGTITVTDVGAALTPGETFQIFSQGISGGGSMAITGGGTGVTWSNNLANAGTIIVQAIVPLKPVIKQTQISGGNFIISGINGTAGDTNIVLTSTNLLLPISQWTPLSTNVFTGSAFSITNPITPGSPLMFYMLQVPY